MLAIKAWTNKPLNIPWRDQIGVALADCWNWGEWRLKEYKGKWPLVGSLGLVAGARDFCFALVLFWKQTFFETKRFHSAHFTHYYKKLKLIKKLLGVLIFFFFYKRKPDILYLKHLAYAKPGTIGAFYIFSLVFSFAHNCPTFQWFSTNKMDSLRRRNPQVCEDAFWMSPLLCGFSVLPEGAHSPAHSTLQCILYKNRLLAAKKNICTLHYLTMVLKGGWFNLNWIWTTNKKTHLISKPNTFPV
jgi:hypothetical protein